MSGLLKTFKSGIGIFAVGCLKGGVPFKAFEGEGFPFRIIKDESFWVEASKIRVSGSQHQR